MPIEYYMVIALVVGAIAVVLGYHFAARTFCGDENIDAIELAIAVILLDLALVDTDFDNDEHAFIIDFLEQFLGVDFNKAYSLIKDAEPIVKEAENIDYHASLLRQELNKSQKATLSQALEELITSNQIVRPFEKALLERYNNLLGIKSLMSKTDKT